MKKIIETRDNMFILFVIALLAGALYTQTKELNKSKQMITSLEITLNAYEKRFKEAVK